MKALKIIGDNVLWSFFMYWRTAQEMSEGNFDVAACLIRVKAKGPSYIKGALLWLNAYKSYQKEQKVPDGWHAHSLLCCIIQEATP